MPQNSCEIMKAAVHFKRPERLPVQMAALGVADNAFLWHPMGKSGRGGAAFKPVAPGADAWGCVWAQTEKKNMGQVVVHPFENGIPENLEASPHPDYSQDIYYEDLKDAISAAEREGKYIQAGLFMALFERVHSMMGFENAMVGIVDPEAQPDVRRLMEFILQAHLTYVDQLDRRFPRRIHAVCMSDDFGTQNAAYVSAGFWMDFFFPYYKRLFDRIRAAGCDVWVHSCGKVNEIVECYIQAGAHVVNLQQPRALGIEEMGRLYRGRIAFESLCDIQATLPTGDKARVAKDVEDLMNHWTTLDGGFVVSDYGDGEAIGVPIEMKLAMYKEFSKWSERIYGKPLPEPNCPKSN